MILIIMQEKMANKEIKLGDYLVSETTKPYMIAEIGINHNGDMQIAKRLLDATFATGWNCAKFQKRVPDIAVPKEQRNVMRETPWGEMTYLEYKYRVEFEKKEYDEIDKYCKMKPLDWTASPWDVPSLDFLAQYDLPFIKIASATITNLELLKKACQYGKPIIMSTGMSTWDEIDEAVDILERLSDGNYILLHTNSNYPSNYDELNLNMIKTLKQRYNCLVGYSGHEKDLEPSVIAATVGACVIERHITLSHEMWGTDQKASLTLPAMGMLKGRIQDINEILGTGEKFISENEMKIRKKLRGN